MFCTASVDRQTHDNSVQPGPGSFGFPLLTGDTTSLLSRFGGFGGSGGKGEKHTIELNIKTLWS